MKLWKYKIKNHQDTNSDRFNKNHTDAKNKKQENLKGSIFCKKEKDMKDP